MLPTPRSLPDSAPPKGLRAAGRLFEILVSDHLNPESIEAQKAREDELRSERERDRGKQPDGVMAASVEQPPPDTTYTFELFVCLAIFKTYKVDLLKAQDMADLFTFINGLVGVMNLDELLSAAEALFFEHCRKRAKSDRTEAFVLLT